MGKKHYCFGFYYKIGGQWIPGVTYYVGQYSLESLVNQAKQEKGAKNIVPLSLIEISQDDYFAFTKPEETGPEAA